MLIPLIRPLTPAQVATKSSADAAVANRLWPLQARRRPCRCRLITRNQAGDGFSKDPQASFTELCAAQPPIFHPTIDRPPADGEQFSRLSNPKH